MIAFSAEESNFEHYKKLEKEFQNTVGIVFVVDRTDLKNMMRASVGLKKLLSI